MAMQQACPSMQDVAAREVTVVRFGGFDEWLDEEILGRVHGHLLDLAEESGDSDLFLDFNDVQYISTRMLGTLVHLGRELTARGRHLIVGNLSPQGYEAFVATRLDKLLDLRRAGQDVGPAAAEERRPTLPLGILVVDDDPSLLGILATKLRLHGFKVWVAGHGAQAIATYQKYRQEISLVLLDVLMPGMDGPGTLAALQRLCPALRVCFMTESPAPYTEQALLEMGATRVFRKPLHVAEITDALIELANQLPRLRQERWIEVSWKGA